jgi:hypothetical protein
MKGVPVIVPEAMVTGAVSVHVSGMAVVETPVRFSVSGLVVVNVGRPTLRVPEAPEVIEPDIVPFSTMTGVVGKVAGFVKLPEMFRVGLPVPPLTVSGTEPEKPVVPPAAISG